MDYKALFTEALEKSKKSKGKPSFREHFYGQNTEAEPTELVENNESIPTAVPAQPKTKVFENLEQFVEKKENPFFETKKDEQEKEPSEISKVEERGQLSSFVISEDILEGANLKVAFVGECPRDHEGPGENEGGLLQKMIGALQFQKGEAIRIFVERLDDNDQVRDQLFSDLYKLKPMVIVSLGAYTTNLILKKKERLSTVHGKTFPLSLQGAEQFSLSCIPVFHPDILSINPNMKRSAWIDLQKVTEYLNSKGS